MHLLITSLTIPFYISPLLLIDFYTCSPGTVELPLFFMPCKPVKRAKIISLFTPC
nr:MAG TPA: hypothetical protein [Caudoviricetes sp.]